MALHRKVIVFILITLMALPFTSSNKVAAADTTGEPSHAYSPVMFVENVGQFDEGARFQVLGGNATLWLANDALWVTVVEQPSSSVNAGSLIAPFLENNSEQQSSKALNIRLSFVGATQHPRLEPFNRLETSVNYFIGNNPEKWHADVPTWGGVRYKNLYPGIDLESPVRPVRLRCRAWSREQAQTWIQIQVLVEGAEEIALQDEKILLKTALGNIPNAVVAGRK